MVNFSDLSYWTTIEIIKFSQWPNKQRLTIVLVVLLCGFGIWKLNKHFVVCNCKRNRERDLREPLMKYSEERERERYVADYEAYAFWVVFGNELYECFILFFPRWWWCFYFAYLFIFCLFFCFLRILIILKHTRGEGRYLKFIKRCNSIKFLIEVYFKTHSVREENVLKKLIMTCEKVCENTYNVV